MVPDQCIYQLSVKSAELHRAEDRLQRALVDALGFIDQKLRIELLRKAQTVAGRTGAERRVERKHPRLQLFDADAVIRTRQLGAEHLFVMMIIKIANHRYKPVALRHSQLAGLRDTALLSRLDHDTVHNDLDGVLIGFFQLDLVLFQQLDLAVHPHTRKSLASNTVENLLVGTLAAALAIVLLFLIIHLADPAFLPHLFGLLARGDIQETAAYIASFGKWAVIFSFLLTLFVNALGFPPAIIFSTANTLIFGIFWGIFLSVTAETVGVLLSFVLLRFFFRDAAEKIINKHPTLSNLDKYSGRRGFVVMLIARMVPYFPSILLNALGALSAMSMRDYVIASFVGKFPSTGIEAIIGHDTLTHQEDPTRLIVVCIFAVILVVGAWIYEKRATKHAPEA